MAAGSVTSRALGPEQQAIGRSSPAWGRWTGELQPQGVSSNPIYQLLAASGSSLPQAWFSGGNRTCSTVEARICGSACLRQCWAMDPV